MLRIGDQSMTFHAEVDAFDEKSKALKGANSNDFFGKKRNHTKQTRFTECSRHDRYSIEDVNLIVAVKSKLKTENS